jgi:putative ATP-dependent DNA ligase
MFSRLIREGFQSFEFGEDEQAVMDRCIRIGEAILKSMVESIREVSEGRKVYEKMRLRFYDLDVFELFKQHVRRMGIDAKFSEPMHDEDSYVVWFYRYMKSTTDKIKHILKGNLWS